MAFLTILGQWATGLGAIVGGGLALIFGMWLLVSDAGQQLFAGLLCFVMLLMVPVALTYGVWQFGAWIWGLS